MILGVGVGIFTLFIVGLVSLVICLFGARSSASGAFCLVGILMFVIVLLIFVLSPKTVDSADDTDTTYPSHVGMMFLACFMLLVGLLGIVVLFFTKNVIIHKILDEQTQPTVVY